MTHGIDSTECKAGPNGYPCEFCQWATSAEQRARHHMQDAQTVAFTTAWENAPREQRNYVEREIAEYWFRCGWQDGSLVHAKETNENLRLMMAARQMR